MTEHHSVSPKAPGTCGTYPQELPALKGQGAAKPTQRRLLIPLIVVLLLVMGSFSVALYSVVQTNLRKDGERNLEMAIFDLVNGLEDRTNMIIALQDVYVLNPQLVRALETQDRLELLRIADPLYRDTHKQHNITHFYFHDTQGVNILRVHQPERFGDRIQRETMRRAMESGKTASGIELGPLGTFTLRVVRPVLADRGRIIGYLEIGQEIEDVLMETCRGRNLELAISIHKEYLDRESWESGMRMLNRNADWNQYEDEVVIFDSVGVASFWDELPRRGYSSVDAPRTTATHHGHLHDSSVAQPDSSTLLWASGKWWHVMSEPVADASGRIVGDLFVMSDVTGVIAYLKKASATGAGIGLTCFVILIWFLYTALRHVDQTIRMREDELRHQNEVLSELLSKEHSTREELETLTSRLEVVATTDDLTGLPNRVMLMENLKQVMEQSRKNGSRYAVLFMDFDRFKVVNDSLNHRVGDALLCDIAKRLRDSLHGEDIVARFGGDEFVVLLKNLASWYEAELIAKALLDILSTPHHLGDYLIVSTASIGLVTSEFTYEDADAMIRDADIAMYQAKGAGKARIAIFDRNMRDSAMDRLRLEADLQLALTTGNQFFLMYQPIIDLESGRLTGFEALLRWKRPGRGLVSPNEFIPIAEDTGMIVEIGRWVIETAAAQIAKWNKDLSLMLPLAVNVNVAKQQLLCQSFLGELLTCKERHGLSDEVFHLEITESMIADNRDAVIPLLRTIREHGFKIAMDDFGTGVSSLSALHEYPIDILKIDQAFIRALDRNRSLLAVVMSITSMADNLNIQTVAEGIESNYVVGALQSINCTWGQGYLFAKPLSVEDAEVFIRKNNSGFSYAA